MEQRSEKAVYWAGHIEAWQRSGLSQGAYCRRHGLSQNSLSYWRAWLGKSSDRGTASSVTIVPVPMPTTAPGDHGSTGIDPGACGDDFRIEIRGDFSATALEKLVRTFTRL